MIFYIFSGLVAVAMAFGYGQTDYMLSVVAGLAITVYVYTTRTMPMRSNAVWWTIILCVFGIVYVAFMISWLADGQHLAALAAAGALAALLHVVKREAPIAYNIIKVAFSKTRAQ